MKRFLCVILSFVMMHLVFAVDFTANASEARFGIDISEHNGDFDLTNQQSQENDFVMIRLGYFTYADKAFEANVKKAVEADMDFGVYLYSYAFDEAEAMQEAKFVTDTLASLDEEYIAHMTLPVAYDLEEQKILSNCNKAQITKNMTVFCDAIKNAGYIPMVYANLNWFTNYIDISTAFSKGYKLWYAYYTDANPSFYKQIEIGNTGIAADMWQYSTTNNTLDKNIMYPSMICGSHNYSESTVLPTCTDKGYVLNTCKECGYYYKSTYTNALGHKTTATKATLTKNGNIKCTRCSNTISTLYYPKTISLSATSYTYDGKVKAPKVTVKGADGKAIAASNYTVSYASGRKNVGKYAVRITFKGNYSGNKTLYFTIVPKGTTIASIAPASKAITVKWKKQATQTTGYQIQYATNAKFTSAKTVTVNNKTTSKKISKLIGKKKYYVRARTYKKVGSAIFYSAWSKSKAVTVKK